MVPKLNGVTVVLAVSVTVAGAQMVEPEELRLIEKDMAGSIPTDTIVFPTQPIESSTFME